MKYSKLLNFFIVQVFFSGTITGTALEQSSIEKKAVIIEKKMTQDRYFFYGLTALGIAYELSQTCAELSKVFSNNVVGKSTTQQEKTSIIEAFKAGLRHLVYTQEGWVATAQVCVGIGSSIFISKMCEKFVHPDTLRWYIHAYAPYHLTSKMMQERLLELQDPSLDKNRAKMCNEVVELLYDRLVHQGLSICAYMTYKLKYLDNEEKVIAERAKIFMLSSQNTWLSRISAQLSADSRDYCDINRLIIAYEADIASQINHFFLIEGETLQDRSTVKRQEKCYLENTNKAN
jgi:hypothetical protein